MGLLDIIRGGRKDLRVLQKLVRVAPTPTAAESLADFINEHSALRKRFLELSEGAAFADSDNTMARFDVSQLLLTYAMHIAEKGDFLRGTASAYYSCILMKENVNALAVQAEMYLAWQDRIAARYAEKVLKFKPPKGKGLIETAIAAPEILEGFGELKERMKVIIRECEAHPEWRDSYPLKEASGIVEELL